MLRVMTLNLNYYVTKHGPWAVRKELIRQIIQEAGPDVIALQAVRVDPTVEDGLDQATQIARLFPRFEQVIFQPAVSYPTGIAEGSAILSQVPLTSTDVLKLSLRPGLEDASPRLVLHSHLELPRGTLNLFNAHFSWVGEQTADNLNETIPFINSFDGPGLLVGDLNTPSDSALLDVLRQAGWTDVWSELRPGQEGFTFEANNPTIRIDYAWANQALLPSLESIQIVGKTLPESEARPSDHTGLLVSLLA